MLIFSTIGVITFLNALVSYVPSFRTCSNVAAILISIVLTLIFMFQYGIGGDYLAYQYLYTKSEMELINRGFAPGFVLLFTSFNNIGLPFQAIYIVLGFFIILLNVLSYKNISQYFRISFPLLLFLFFSWLYLDYLGVLRQALAQTLLLYAYSCILQKKVKISVLITSISILFHYSSAFFFVFYLVKYFPLKHSVKLMLAIVAAFAFVLFGGVSFIAETWVGLKLPFHTYFTSSIWLAKETTLYSKIVCVILIFFLIFVLNFRRKLKIPKDLTYFVMCYVLLRAFTMDWHAGHRVLMLYEPFLLIFVGYLLDKAMPRIFVQKTLPSLCLAILLFAHMLGNQVMRLLDDPNFIKFSLTLDGAKSAEYRLDILK